MADADHAVASCHLRMLLDVGTVVGLSDGQLLDLFESRRDEKGLHGADGTPQADGAAGVRRVLGNHHDAEDAFQATFLELARRVGSIRRRESAGRAEGATRSPAPSKRGWLLSPHGRCPNRYESGSKSTCPVTLAICLVKIA